MRGRRDLSNRANIFGIGLFGWILDKDHTQTLCLGGPYITLLHAVQTNYGMLRVGPMELGYLCGYAHGDRLSSAM